MTKAAKISCLTLALCLTGGAQAGESARIPYVSLKVGAAVPKDNKITTGSILFDNDVVVAGAIGLVLQKSLRLELEGSHRRFTTRLAKLNSGTEYKVNGHVEHKALLANLYYDFPLTESLRFYLGGGAGMSLIDTKIDTITTGSTIIAFSSQERDSGFAYQLGSGFSFNFTERFATDFGYRFLVTHNNDDSLSIHEITAGLRYGY
ncbi:MAG: porin family protein [Magnetococcales bacterium]|nr:porin family protein [Magnetococcales bacterium]